MSKGGDNLEHNWRRSWIKDELLYFLLSFSLNRRHLSRETTGRRMKNTRDGKFETRKKKRKTGGGRRGRPEEDSTSFAP